MRCLLLPMGIPKNRKTSQIIHFNRIFHYKPSIFRYHIFGNTPMFSGPSKTVLALLYHFYGLETFKSAFLTNSMRVTLLLVLMFLLNMTPKSANGLACWFGSRWFGFLESPKMRGIGIPGCTLRIESQTNIFHH